MVGSRQSPICWKDQFSKKKKKKRKRRGLDLSQEAQGRDIHFWNKTLCGTRGLVPMKRYCYRDVRLTL